MSDHRRLGIDPVDFKELDESKVMWDTENQQWVMGDGESLHCHMYGPKVDKLPIGESFIWDNQLELENVKSESKYDPKLDNAYSGTVLLATLYHLGFSDNEILNLCVDDAVKRIRQTYNYTLNSIDSAGKTYIKRKNIALMRQLRRSYQKVQITEGLFNGS